VAELRDGLIRAKRNVAGHREAEHVAIETHRLVEVLDDVREVADADDVPRRCGLRRLLCLQRSGGGENTSENERSPAARRRASSARHQSPPGWTKRCLGA